MDTTDIVMSSLGFTLHTAWILRKKSTVGATLSAYGMCVICVSMDLHTHRIILPHILIKIKHYRYLLHFFNKSHFLKLKTNCRRHL